MKNKFDAAVRFLRSTSSKSYTLAAILSLLAELIVRFAIPGGGLLEIAIAIAVALGVFIVTLVRESQDDGLVQSIHNNYAKAC